MKLSTLAISLFPLLVCMKPLAAPVPEQNLDQVVPQSHYINDVSVYNDAIKNWLDSAKASHQSAVGKRDKSSVSEGAALPPFPPAPPFPPFSPGGGVPALPPFPPAPPFPPFPPVGTVPPALPPFPPAPPFPPFPPTGGVPALPPFPPAPPFPPFPPFPARPGVETEPSEDATLDSFSSE